MDRTRRLSLSVTRILVISNGGPALTQEPTPLPVPPPVQRPEALPSPPDVQTFAVGMAGTTGDGDNVVSVAQARDGSSCPASSSTGTCTFQSHGDPVGVYGVCRP